MLFNDPIYFALFLPLVFLGFHLLNSLSLSRVATIGLVAASLFFYAYWKIEYLFILVGSVCINYVLGQMIAPDRASGGLSRYRKGWLIFGIVGNTALLGVYKYADFFIANINAAADAGITPLHLILPLAISFFTFQQIAYLVDSYKGVVRHDGFINYALFVTFFPQLIAGPIVHHSEMMPQFADPERRKLIPENVAAGLFIFLIGLTKKIVLADTFAFWANRGFVFADSLSFFEAWMTSLSYTFQLYFDFSGYADMAIGSALLFNIRLPINFNAPYRALNIQDFWRRWHMTLSRWLRDYIYIPLGGNRAGTPKLLTNLFLTFLIGGIWHGAAWTFVAWGAMHGMAIVIHRLWCMSGLRMNRWLAWIVTFLFINTTWVFFRANSFSDAIAILKSMAGLSGFTPQQNFPSWLNYFTGFAPGKYLPGLPAYGLSEAAVFIVLVGFALCLLMPTSQHSLNNRLIGKHWTSYILPPVLIVLTCLFTIGSQPSPFLYFNF